MMEALNIADDRLDLDSNEQNKGKGKTKDNENVEKYITEIKELVNELRQKDIKDIDISKAIKEVFSDGGKPSANFVNCSTEKEAKAIIDNLKKKFN